MVNRVYFSAVPRHVALRSVAAMMLAVSCRQSPQTDAVPAAEQERALAAYAAQRLVVVPTGVARAADSLGWVRRAGGSRVAARQLDTMIVETFEARGLGSRWIFPAELWRSYERNRSYASDPYQLVWDPVLSPRFKTGERYGEPLSSQLRTMIALHDDARFVLLPIELRFERDVPAAGGSGVTQRAVLRAAVVDARTTEARWVGEVRGDPAADAPTAMRTAAERMANLFVSP